MFLVSGTRLGRYEIRAPLGAGGMGEVYRAIDVELERPVALKFLPAEVASDPKRMNRFVQEAKAAAGRKGARPSVSPDGQWLAYFSPDVSDQHNLNVVSVTGEGPMQTFALPRTATGGWATFAIHWTPDSRSMCYTDNPAVNVSQITCQPREGGNPSRLVEFNSGEVLYFAFSPDQKQVLVSRSFFSDDVVLIRDALDSASGSPVAASFCRASSASALSSLVRILGRFGSAFSK